MKAKTLTPIGSLHPVLFFAGVYVVALVFSIFICSTLFYSCNSSASSDSGITRSTEKVNAAQEAVLALK